jgi:excinuclease UvrABC helicase subunit UvrB
LRARVDQTTNDVSAAHKVGIGEHLEEVLSMSFVQRSAFLVPCALLEFFPMPFVLGIDDERPPLELQDQVGDE